jgi:hypothetical protein
MLKDTLIKFAKGLYDLAGNLASTDVQLKNGIDEIEGLIGGSGAKTDQKVNIDLDNAANRVKDAADSLAAASKTLSDYASSL